MTVEQSLKSIIGEQAFQICVLNAQVEELQKQLEEKKTKEAETNED